MALSTCAVLLICSRLRAVGVGFRDDCCRFRYCGEGGVYVYPLSEWTELICGSNQIILLGINKSNASNLNRLKSQVVAFSVFQNIQPTNLLFLRRPHLSEIIITWRVERDSRQETNPNDMLLCCSASGLLLSCRSLLPVIGLWITKGRSVRSTKHVKRVPNTTACSMFRSRHTGL